MKALRIFMVMALGIVLAMGLVACGSSDSGGDSSGSSCPSVTLQEGTNVKVYDGGLGDSTGGPETDIKTIYMLKSSGNITVQLELNGDADGNDNYKFQTYNVCGQDKDNPYTYYIVEANVSDNGATATIHFEVDNGSNVVDTPTTATVVAVNSSHIKFTFPLSDIGNPTSTLIKAQVRDDSGTVVDEEGFVEVIW